MALLTCTDTKHETLDADSFKSRALVVPTRFPGVNKGFTGEWAKSLSKCNYLMYQSDGIP